VDETRVRELLEQATTGEPPLGPVVERAIAAGERVRRRRRMMGVAGCVAVVALAAGLVPVLGRTRAIVPVAPLTTSSPATQSPPACGSPCGVPYVKEYGGQFVLDVYKQLGKLGQSVILFAPSGTDQSQGWTITATSTVATFYRGGVISAAVDLHYAAEKAYEIEYTPHGQPSGLCLGVPTRAADGTDVKLVQCGVSARTVWISEVVPAADHFVPLINGSDTNFVNPYVLTYPSGANPLNLPRTPLTTERLKRSGSAYDDNQLWG
jgi:hypothetical protein